VLLAKMILQQPDLLLLDEPTNHLDLPSIEWLEKYLVHYQGSVVIVSHDKYFLNRMVTKIVELYQRQLHIYSGNYDYYETEKALRIEMQQRAFENQQDYIRQQERFIERFKAKASKAAQAQSVQKRLDKLERIEDVALAEQPRTLDEAALTFCIGGPFHPGCEMTWPMRHVTMYYAPFRIRPRAPEQPEPDYGPMLDPSIINDDNENSPLCASGPGDITRWMAVPWQTDTASCQAGYEPEFDPFLPTFWPARVPNQVLSVENYNKVMDTELPRADRLAAFNERMDWDRTLGAGYQQQLQAMVDHFDRQGIVEVRPGIPDDPDFPPLMQVEDRGGQPMSAAERKATDSQMRQVARRGTPKPSK